MNIAMKSVKLQAYHQAVKAEEWNAARHFAQA